MPRSPASILRQRQVRMYRAACIPIIRLHIFSLSLLALFSSGTLLFSYILSLALEGRIIFYRTSLYLSMESTLSRTHGSSMVRFSRSR